MCVGSGLGLGVCSSIGMVHLLWIKVVKILVLEKEKAKRSYRNCQRWVVEDSNLRVPKQNCLAGKMFMCLSE